MGRHAPNTTEYSRPHISTTPKEHGNNDEGKCVVTSRSYDSNGKVVRGSAKHHTSDSGDTGMFGALFSLFGCKKWFRANKVFPCYFL